MSNNILQEQKGFMLIEILVVIAIIGLLATIAVAGVKYARDKGRIAAAEADIDTIHKAVGELMVDTNEWPGHQTPEQVNTGGSNEIWDLSSTDSGIVATDGSFSNWQGPYLSNIPTDPWGNNYFFDTDYQVDSNNEPCNGAGGCVNQPVLGSFGPNGTGQNDYDADDIIKIVR